MKGKQAGKILVIPSWYPPKGGYFFREHAIALAGEGMEVDVLAGLHTSLRTLRLKELQDVRKIEVHTLDGITEYLKKYWIIPFSNRPNFHGWISMMLRFFRKYQERQGPPDLILAHSSIWAGLVAAFIKEKYGIPYVITEHRSRFVYNTPEARQQFEPWFFPYLKTAFEGAAAVVTVSEALQPLIREIAPETEGRLHCIPNMVDTDFFHLAKGEKPLKPFRFFSLANLIPLKGMDTLIEAFAIATKTFQGDCQLVIGGDGTERPRLERLIVDKKLQGKVVFAGKLNRSQVLEQMQQAHAFVLASHFEAFGVVFIEAMATGLPLIATRSGGPGSIINKNNGLLAEPDKPDKLAEALHEMMNQYNQFQPAQIREEAITRYGKSAVARQYIELFDTIKK